MSTDPARAPRGGTRGKVTDDLEKGVARGRLFLSGRLGERQGRVLAPIDPRKEGAMHAGGRGLKGGARGRLHEPDQTALGFLARFNVPGGTVADLLEPERAVQEAAAMAGFGTRLTGTAPRWIYSSAF